MRPGSLLIVLIASITLLLAACFAPKLHAQTSPANENLIIRAHAVTTWQEKEYNIVQLAGPVSIELDQTHLAADNAVIWLSPIKGAMLDEQKAEIVLVEHAEVTQSPGVVQTAETQYVTAVIRGSIRVTADTRQVRDLSSTDLFKLASQIRPPDPNAPVKPGEEWLLQRPWLTPPTPATTQPVPTSQPVPHFPVNFDLNKAKFVKTSEDLVAIVLTDGATIAQSRPMDEFFSMQANSAVLFTPLHSLRELGKSSQYKSVEDAVTGAYLEGDVRIIHTPNPTKGSEQRLRGERVYYDFTTDRAVLTQAVVHSFDLKSETPLIVRAQTIHQLSEGEFTADHAELTTSGFATPSYSIGMQKAYVRSIETGDPRYGSYSVFTGEGTTIQVMRVPFFYLPYVAGSFNEKGSVLRALETKSGNRYGTGLVTQWGLFETLGQLPPPDTDITYEADYFSKRGPAAGIGGHYLGGVINDTTHDAWSFQGNFRSLIMDDVGKDILSRDRLEVKPGQDLRGRLFWEHQHVLPNDWTIQLRADYVSDPTFLEEFYPNEYYREPQHDTSVYVKHQTQTEALTFLVSGQPANFVTSADAVQEQFEVQKLPELAYHRIGDSFGGDAFTFFSDNSIAGMNFRRSSATLTQQGFAPGQTPGIAATGLTGTTGNTVLRSDFRQEVDLPFSIGTVRFVPYVEGRYTLYSDSPGGTSKNRLYAAAGTRITTAFSKIDDTVNSELFDLHRLRHVVEPELNLFTSAENVNRSHLYDWEEQVDAINDITGAQIALRQRWQTKRGGVDRWRSVDFLSLNIEANLYSHKPNDRFLTPTDFRGLFFDSLPETSIPRNSVNADSTWRVSDETAVLSDAEYNLDKRQLATASVGVAVQRDERINYFLGTRYIKEFNSNIITGSLNYQLTNKYSVAVRQSFDLGQQHSITSELTVLRHFDRIFAGVTLRYDYIANDSGILFNIYPEGFGAASSSRLTGVFQK